MSQDFDVQDTVPGPGQEGDFAKIQSERIDTDVRICFSFHNCDSISISVMK